MSDIIKKAITDNGWIWDEEDDDYMIKDKSSSCSYILDYHHEHIYIFILCNDVHRSELFYGKLITNYPKGELNILMMQLGITPKEPIITHQEILEHSIDVAEKNTLLNIKSENLLLEYLSMSFFDRIFNYANKVRRLIKLRIDLEKIKK